MASSFHPTMRLAIAQLQMHWTIEANMRSMLQAIELAHGQGAAVCTFPELAVTGFHREIVALAHPERVLPEVRKLQEQCARLSIAIAVGAPTFGPRAPGSTAICSSTSAASGSARSPSSD